MEAKIIICPYCKNKGKISFDLAEENPIKCPNCKGIFNISKEKVIKSEKKNWEK